MFTQALWWTTNTLEFLLIGRAARGKFLKAYPIFYTYLTYVFAESLLRFYVYLRYPESYSVAYWSTQMVSVLVGYAVVGEICRLAFGRYPGAFRMARSAVMLVFVVVTAKVFAGSLSGGAWSLAQTTVELERAFRSVQALLILAVVGVLAYYRIRIGRNLLGLICGYGFFIAASMANLTVQPFWGPGMQWLWQYLPAGAYLVALLIWCVTLWSYQPNPEPEAEARIEHDYQSIVSATRRRFREVRTHVGRTVRP